MTIQTKRRQRHSPEQIDKEVQDPDRTLAEAGDVVAALCQLTVTN